MTAQSKDIDRKVIPRFHSPGAASRQGEIGTVRRAAPPALLPETSAARDESLRQLRREWEEHRSPAFAADYVSAALVLRGSEGSQANDAAEFLLSQTDVGLRAQLARRLLGAEIRVFDDDFDPLAQDDARRRIRDLKQAVRRDPRAALVWAELARRYAAMGQKNAAGHAMDTALALAPHDRFILRSASRLNLHLGDAERAHSILASAPGTRSDPWLLAGEIATAPLAGRSSRLIKHGRRLVESNQFRPLAVSELAAALATEAFQAGRKDARTFFATSLDDPTENALAQVEWASRRGARVEIEQKLLEVEGSWEARAQAAAQVGDLEAAIQNAWRWLSDEPFASLAAVFGSHEAALARQFDVAAEFASAGLVANPDDALLRNNLVFALASADRVEEAEHHLHLLEGRALDDEMRLVVTATRGLVAFRRGDPELGRQLYRETIEAAEDPALRAIAAIVLAREEVRTHPALAAEAREAAEKFADVANKLPSARREQIAVWLAHLRAEIDAAVT